MANEAVGSIRTIASFCAESKVMDMYRKKCLEPEKQGVRLGLVSAAGFGFSFLVLYCTNAFCFYIGSVLVQHGLTTFAEVFKVKQVNQNLLLHLYFDASFDQVLTTIFVQVFFCLTITALGISQTSALAPDTNKAKDCAASIFNILDSTPTIDSSNTQGRTLEAIAGDIELQHVCFNYPTRPHIQIFKDLCLSILAGKVVN